MPRSEREVFYYWGTISSFSLPANSKPNLFSFPQIPSCLSRPWRIVPSKLQAQIFRDCACRAIGL